MPPYPGFVGPSYQPRSKIAADDRLVNLFVEKVESGTGKASYTFYRTPGYTEYCDTGGSVGRGLFTMNGAMFAVVDESLYQLPFTVGGSPILLATGISNLDNTPVTFAGSGDVSLQIMITSCSKLYCYDVIAQTLTLIPQIPATQVVFINGTFFALDPTTSTMYASAPLNGLSWDVLDKAQREDSGDKWQAMVLLQKEIWAMGSQTSSPYFDAGQPSFPYVPNPSIQIPRGVIAPASVLALLVDGRPMWLGQGVDGAGVVYRAIGYIPDRVSNYALEYALQQYERIDDAEAITYQLQGHTFYELTFPTANATWVYDVTSGMWCERGPYNGLDYDGTTARGHIFANGVHLVCDRASGVIWSLSLDVATEMDGETIRVMRRAPHLCDELTRIVYDRFQLDMEVGTTPLQTGNGSDPVMILRWSNDGGQSWSNDYTAPIGRIGQFGTRVIWRRLGQGRDRIFEISCNEPIPIGIVAAYLDYRPGVS